MGIIPQAGKMYLVFQLSRYSALPTNIIWRPRMPMSNAESRNEMWFGAMIAGPSSGTFSNPTSFVGHTNFDAGRSRALAIG